MSATSVAQWQEHCTGIAKAYCGGCEKSWSRKAGFDEHFKLTRIKSGDSGGALIRNPCYEQKRKVWGYTLEEARAKKKQKTVNAFTCITQAANKDFLDHHDDMPECSEPTQAERNDALVDNRLLQDIL